MTNEKAIKYLKQLYPNGGHCWLDEQRIEAIGMAVKALQEEPVSEQNLSNVERTVKNWKEPVSDDFTKALAECIHQAQGSVVDPMVFAETWKDELIKLSKCEEPVSEDLEREIDSYFAKWLQGASDEGCFNPDSQLVSIYDCHRIARHFANWQKQKDKSKVLTEEQCRKIRDDAFELGKDAMKQQMMAKAIRGHIGQTINGMLRALSDETFGDIGFTAGDKVKLIIIKAD